jgi:hypothetical protein
MGKRTLEDEWPHIVGWLKRQPLVNANQAEIQTIARIR